MINSNRSLSVTVSEIWPAIIFISKAERNAIENVKSYKLINVCYGNVENEKGCLCRPIISVVQIFQANAFLEATTACQRVDC